MIVKVGCEENGEKKDVEMAVKSKCTVVKDGSNLVSIMGNSGSNT